MKISAIICECNPLHIGHEYLIDQTRKNGATHIIAIMSGNFVQRGDVSIVSKWAKTRMALESGVDLVIELPTIFSMSCAEKFAKSGIYIANSLGCVDELDFGSECGDINTLEKLSKIINSEVIKEKLKENLNKGITFVKAREIAIQESFSKEISNIIKTPNNVLGIEYIRAINNLKSSINPVTFERKILSSASDIRSLIFNKNNKIYSKFLSTKVMKILEEEIRFKRAPVKINYGERAILSKLRTMTKEDFLRTTDVSEGLENRIFNAVKSSNSIESLYNNVKTKRYTLARIRRIILSSYLGIKKEYENKKPEYIKILGFNEKGKEVLNIAKKSATLPIVTRANELDETECLFSNLYSVFMPEIEKCDIEKTNGVIRS